MHEGNGLVRLTQVGPPSLNLCGCDHPRLLCAGKWRQGEVFPIETTRLITHSFCDSFKNGWIGRRLPRLFEQHAMTDVRVSPQTIFFVGKAPEGVIPGSIPLRGLSRRQGSSRRYGGGSNAKTCFGRFGRH